MRAMRLNRTLPAEKAMVDQGLLVYTYINFEAVVLAN
jgi:hypothetical protein